MPTVSHDLTFDTCISQSVLPSLKTDWVQRSVRIQNVPELVLGFIYFFEVEGFFMCLFIWSKEIFRIRAKYLYPDLVNDFLMEVIGPWNICPLFTSLFIRKRYIIIIRSPLMVGKLKQLRQLLRKYNGLVVLLCAKIQNLERYFQFQGKIRIMEFRKKLGLIAN